MIQYSHEKTIINPSFIGKIIYEAESADAPYVAYAPELDVSSCGSSEEAARKNLNQVIKILSHFNYGF